MREDVQTLQATIRDKGAMYYKRRDAMTKLSRLDTVLARPLLMEVLSDPEKVLRREAALLLASDIRWGSPGPHKIALNETAIGLPLPTFATELAVTKLSRRHLTRAGMMAEFYHPESAVDAGFLDRVCPEGALHDELSAEAARLGAQAGKHFAITKKRLHEETVDRIRASLASEF